jgi:hypothetical protein
MNYIITDPTLTQTFAAPTDSVSVAKNIPGYCGTFEYSLLPATTSAWISVDANRKISVHTDTVSYGYYLMTLNVKLASFPGVTAA